MDSYNLTHTGAELDSAVGRALEGFAAADAATKAANDAAKLAEDTAAEVQKKLDNGEFIGPIGKSGVYVGSGEMPEGYTVQVDPTGDMLCYTAGESDDRYANVLTGTASGPVAALEDVSPTGALRRAAVLGTTTEAGTGGKGPDNPYAIAGIQPTKVTACGENLLDAAQVKYADNSDPVEKFPGGFYLQPNTQSSRIVTIPCPFKAGNTYVVSYSAENVGSGSVKTSIYLPKLNQYLNGAGKPFVPNRSEEHTSELQSR